MKFRTSLANLTEAPGPEEDLQVFKQLCLRKWNEIGSDLEAGGGTRLNWADAVLDRLYESVDKNLLDRMLSQYRGQMGLIRQIEKWL